MNYEITGKLIVKDEVKSVSDRFKKRDFVIEVENEKNSDWNDFVKIQLTQDRCDIIEPMNINDMVKVSFNLRGRKWENGGTVSYFTNLEGWRVEMVNQTNDAPPASQYTEADISTSVSEVDTLPF